MAAAKRRPRVADRDAVPRTRGELRDLAKELGLARLPGAVEPPVEVAAAAEGDNAFHIAPPKPACTCMKRALSGRAFMAVHCKMHSKSVKGSHPRAHTTKGDGGYAATAGAAVARRLDEYEVPSIAPPSRIPAHAISRSLCDEMIDKYTLFLQQAEPWTPEMAEVFTRRSTLFGILRKWEHSRRDALKAAVLDETYVPGLYRLGVALYHIGRYDEAAAAFAKARKFEPDNPDLRHAFDMAMRQTRTRKHRRKLPPVALPATPLASREARPTSTDGGGALGS
mmetsp:Transcript_17864/g.63056  ORF Transcript_17864/g.63056 Transcript_17864/m.63056 type:complete len:281 (-) Transcript_17864:375-1217(-)